MNHTHAVLIVDDEVANLQKLRRTFVNEYQVYEAQSGDEALAVLKKVTVTAIITDQRMPGMTGIDLLRQALTIQPDAVRIVLTGYTDVEYLMDAINQGQVHRYITKPWEPLALKEAVRQELERWELKKENERLGEQLRLANERLERENFQLRQDMELLDVAKPQLVYESRQMRDLMRLLDRVVPTDSTVLIQGETGTGKELLARYIHDHSPRRDQAFVAVNCGAIPTELAESSFFGHRKGAFTGATESRKGYFELAHQGTLFLDEVGEAPLDLQVKLLRVLQEGEILPVGAQSPIQIDVRIIASTNRMLSLGVEEGRFRQDLFFRLNVFSVLIPPLRARIEDIEALARFFLQKFCGRMRRTIPGFEDSTLAILKSFDWPGNVRELENEIERLVILGESGQPIAPAMVSERIRFRNAPAPSGGNLKDRLAELERGLILEALRTYNDNKSRAAEALGITRQTIIAKLKQYQIGER